MKLAVGAASAAFFLGIAAAGAAGGPPKVVGPDTLFAQGQFEAARVGYAAVPKSDPNYETALRQLGAIALYKNHLNEAEAMLNDARARSPTDMRCVSLLAETFNRAGKFPQMAQLLRQIGRPERAAEFELFGKAEPYRVVGKAGTVSVEFQQTDPVPVVRAKVNGLDGIFLVDTGGPEIVLDPEFATAARLQMTTRNNTSGRTATPTFGRIGQFVLNTLETDDIPAIILSTKGFTSLARNKRVAGIIGTEFLSHFKSTLDYEHGRLILEPRDASAHPATSVAEIPFWFVGDHFLLANGRLDQGPRQLFLIDTGFEGFAFVAPASTLHDAGVSVPAPAPTKAIGPPPTAKFPVASLSLGTLEEKNVTGVYGPFPPGLEQGLGVHVGGMVSHGFFQPYAVTFDFVQMKIAIRK